MSRFFAVVMSALLVFGFTPVAKADVAGLTPCAESARFQQRAAAATTPLPPACQPKALCRLETLQHTARPAPPQIQPSTPGRRRREAVLGQTSNP